MRVTGARLIRLRDSCQFEAWVTLESVHSGPVLAVVSFPTGLHYGGKRWTKLMPLSRPF